MNFLRLPLVWLCLLSCYAWPVYAHAPGLSSIDLVINGQQISVKVTFAAQEIEAFVPMDSDLDAEVSTAELDAAKPKVGQLIAEKIQLSSDGQPQQPQPNPAVSFDDQNNAQVELSYAPVPQQQLELDSKFLADLPEGHQHFVTIKDASGKTLLEKMLDKPHPQLTLDLTTPAAVSTGFLDFFELGIEHIVTGYDHLLFLFSLLLVTHSLRPALKIITFFTIAHSITLAVAGLNLLELPSSFVEPFIAATIVYVAVENLIRGEHPKGRYWLTFAFGLIHGFGFASVLRELDISSGDSGILLPLLSFNLGIESGQITVAAVVLPVIWWINNQPKRANIFLKAGSVLVALIGAWWFVERTLL